MMIRKTKPQAKVEFSARCAHLDVLMSSLQGEVSNLTATRKPGFPDVGTADELIMKLQYAVAQLRGGEPGDVLTNAERGLPEVGDVIELNTYRAVGMVLGVEDLGRGRMAVRLQQPDDDDDHGRTFELGHGEFVHV